MYFVLFCFVTVGCSLEGKDNPKAICLPQSTQDESVWMCGCLSLLSRLLDNINLTQQSENCRLLVICLSQEHDDNPAAQMVSICDSVSTDMMSHCVELPVH